MNRKFISRLILLQVVFALVLIIACPPLIGFVKGQGGGEQADPTFVSMVIIGIAISIAVPSVAASYMMKTSATAAISALTERESTFGKALIFVALGEALAIYGLIIAILLMQYLPAA